MFDTKKVRHARILAAGSGDWPYFIVDPTPLLPLSPHAQCSWSAPAASAASFSRRWS
jgi:hypothetical protein